MQAPPPISDSRLLTKLPHFEDPEWERIYSDERRAALQRGSAAGYVAVSVLLILFYLADLTITPSNMIWPALVGLATILVKGICIWAMKCPWGQRYTSKWTLAASRGSKFQLNDGTCWRMTKVVIPGIPSTSSGS